MTNRELVMLLNIQDETPKPRKLSRFEAFLAAIWGCKLCYYDDSVESIIGTRSHMASVLSAAASDKRPEPPEMRH